MLHSGQVVTCMIGHWNYLNMLYHMHYNCTGVLWYIQRRMQNLQNIHFDSQIQDAFAKLGPSSWSTIYLLVPHLEKMAANGVTICTIHPTNAHYLLHSNSVTTSPKEKVTTCPNVVSLTKFVIVENAVYLTSSFLYTWFGIYT